MILEVAFESPLASESAMLLGDFVFDFASSTSVTLSSSTRARRTRSCSRDCSKYFFSNDLAAREVVRGLHFGEASSTRHGPTGCKSKALIPFISDDSTMCGTARGGIGGLGGVMDRARASGLSVTINFRSEAFTITKTGCATLSSDTGTCATLPANAVEHR